MKWFYTNVVSDVVYACILVRLQIIELNVMAEWLSINYNDFGNICNHSRHPEIYKKRIARYLSTTENATTLFSIKG